jgi:hypothetical protein
MTVLLMLLTCCLRCGHNRSELATGGQMGRVGMDRTEIVECPTHEGCHYDYDRQIWVDGHDHYHVLAGSVERLYCGQALAGCQRTNNRHEVTV